MRLRKEISESFGILHAILDCCVQLGIIVDHTATTTTADITITDNDNINDNDNNNSNDECNGRSYNSNGIFNFDNICLIDLCSGKGITTALCDALNQGRCQAVGEENINSKTKNNNNNNNNNKITFLPLIKCYHNYTTLSSKSTTTLYCYQQQQQQQQSL
jgi:hypothetical protein